MDLNLAGKNALVCGSSQGIGKAAAVELSLLGCSVTLVSRNGDRLNMALNDLDTTLGQTHDYLIADIGDVLRLKREVEAELEDKSFHILVNNTGGPPAGRLIDAGPKAFLEAFNAHLIASHMLVQLLVPGMVEDNYGRIINITSTTIKEPVPNLGLSNSIRAAVANWAKTLAGELGHLGITINNVLPGSTNTERHRSLMAYNADKSGKSLSDVKETMTSTIPLRRFADPLEVGAAVAFLASPAAGYITGINLPVDGGRTKSL
ncbi:MAG: SDR family oxidoreductase [Bacteroidota bacterium]